MTKQKPQLQHTVMKCQRDGQTETRRKVNIQLPLTESRPKLTRGQNATPKCSSLVPSMHYCKRHITRDQCQISAAITARQWHLTPACWTTKSPNNLTPSIPHNNLCPSPLFNPYISPIKQFRLWLTSHIPHPEIQNASRPDHSTAKPQKTPAPQRSSWQCCGRFERWTRPPQGLSFRSLGLGFGGVGVQPELGFCYGHTRPGGPKYPNFGASCMKKHSYYHMSLCP